MEVRIVEDLRKNFFGQDVLNQHFPHVSCGDVWIDCVLCMLEEAKRVLTEIYVALLSLDHVAQRLEHLGQVGLELLDRLAKIRDLLALVAKE
jgi:hypothetical protein